MPALFLVSPYGCDLRRMEIEAKRNDEGGIDLQVGGQTVVLDEADARELNARLSHALAPEPAELRSQRVQEFLLRLRSANDSGIQGLLRNAGHDDVLILLKSAEEDAPLRARLYANMTERSAQLFAEDLQFRFNDELPALLAEEALSRLMVAADQLADDGTLTFEGPHPANS
jgi:hypothetical protein